MHTRLLLLLSLSACLSKPGFEGGPGGDAGHDGSSGDASTDDPGLLAVGARHACATSRGRLYCWGNNTHGQLGGPSPSTGTPREVSTQGPTTWTHLVAGDRHTCGLHDGEIDCWGDDAARQAGGGESRNQVPLPGGAQPRSLHAGGTASCAIDTQGQLFCWGTIADRVFDAPTRLTPGGHAGEWTSVALASDHACALRADGTAWCWGENDRSQLGAAMATTHAPDDAVALVAGDDYLRLDALTVERHITCGITRAPDRRLTCVGWAAAGEIYPLGTNVASPTPVVIGGTSRTWAAADLAPRHACGIASEIAGGPTSVVCLGHDTDGALGNAFTRDPAPAIVVGAPAEPTKIATGDHLSCARNATQVMCWGANRDGELGNGAIASSRTPHRALSVPDTEDLHAIVTGTGHTCAIATMAVGGSDTGGRVYCWGDNRERQVDWTNTEEMITTPRAMNVSDATVVSASTVHTCARRVTGDIECWGSNAARQLGIDLVTARHQVVAPPGPGGWRTVAAGSSASCAVTQPGALHCWGAIPGAALPGPHLAVGATGDVWHDDLAFGSGVVVGGFRRQGTDHLGAFGQQCPVGGATVMTSPPHLPFLYSTRAASPQQIQLAASAHTCLRVIQANVVEVYCAGNNQQGQITGVPNSTNSCRSETRVEPPPGRQWATYVDDEAGIAAGPTHTCALVARGSTIKGNDPFCWGTNAYGAMGTLSGPSGPAMVAELDVVEIATAARHTCAITRDRKSVYCWGDNRYGEVGNGARFHERPVEVQFP